ncbi:hypothetical protein [Sinomonas flava]|uniref:hypothetical protein n=1 Tax=Sinomonas flava TaxID=496857 RepID=UPI0039A75225
MLRAVSAAAICLSGCAAPATQSSSATSTHGATPTPTPTASARQFASILAEYEKDWRDYEDNIFDCALAGVQKDTISSVKRLTCSMTVQIVTLNANTALRDIMKLPTPEPEVKSLVDRTIAALAPLSQIDAVTACKDQASAACDAAEIEANGAIRGLVSILDAWKPYL